MDCIPFIHTISELLMDHLIAMHQLGLQTNNSGAGGRGGAITTTAKK